MTVTDEGGHFLLRIRIDPKNFSRITFQEKWSMHSTNIRQLQSQNEYHHFTQESPTCPSPFRTESSTASTTSDRSEIYNFHAGEIPFRG